MTSKMCTKCNIDKLLEEFSAGHAFLGKKAHCRACVSETHRKQMLNQDYRNSRRVKSKEAREKHGKKYKVKYKEKYNKRKNDEKFKLQARGLRITRYWPGSTWQEALQNYEALLIEHNHSCAVCKKHKSHFSRNLSVDHNHKTGKVRGLLCYRCNRLYVNINTIETAKAVYEYLVKYDE